jgi:hypothetical protein
MTQLTVTFRNCFATAPKKEPVSSSTNIRNDREQITGANTRFSCVVMCVGEPGLRDVQLCESSTLLRQVPETAVVSIFITQTAREGRVKRWPSFSSECCLPWNVSWLCSDLDTNKSSVCC